MNYQKVNNTWKSILSYYRKNNDVWEQINAATFENLVSSNMVTFGGEIKNNHTLSIGGISTISGASCSFTAIYDNVTNVTSAATWSIVSGSSYAIISAHTGEVEILSTANDSDVIIQASYLNVTTTKNVTLTYKAGTTSETETEIITDASGNTTTTTTTTTTNEDGSSSVITTTVVTDESGNTIGSSESNKDINSDGSFNATTTNYDSEGNATDGINQSGDTSGNVSSQEVEYDESGNTTVTGYQIDTSGNPDGTKEFNGDGVNTEYYAFDVTQGFITDIHFVINSNNSPTGQNENHHNILTAKRSSPSPWYGFQLRQTLTTKTITLGTQFSTGSNINTTIQPMSTTGANLEYNLRIIYNPTVSTNSFICRNMATGQNVYTSNGKFPDIDDLKYIKVTIGYAMDENGDPFRYSDIDVKNFSIRRLEQLYPPVISCSHNVVTISCETTGADIYYKLNQIGSFIQYTSAFTISADTIVDAYAVYCDVNSDTVTEVCRYEEEGVKAPVITCDGTGVTITCETEGATIYYKCNHVGGYSAYTQTFPITADTFVESYSMLDEETSEVVSEMCIYSETHDYSLDYLTFRIKSGGTISWNSVGTQQVKAIQYSLNNGSWTYLVPSSVGSSVSITVSEDDVVRIKGSNASYGTTNADYMGFSGGTAVFDVEGNIMSLVYGDNFVGNTALTGTYNFCSLFKQANVISAENLVLPATTLNEYCYRAMFSRCYELVKVVELPATTLAKGCYWYMFDKSASFEVAPELPATTLVEECYGHMFEECTSLNYIKCMATTGFKEKNCKASWTSGVSATGTFVKDSSVPVSTWSKGASGIPTGWLVYDDVAIDAPVISCDGYNNVTITCDTTGATIYYKLNGEGNYATYNTPIVISTTTVVEAYSEKDGQESRVVSQTCEYISNIPLEACNRDLTKWTYSNQEITTPYSVNRIDGHSASYTKGTFNFETSFALREVQPTYLWFQHADQSATIYVDDVLVEKHWGGYAAFSVDISEFVHSGTNRVKVALKNNEGNNLAPASADFNFNATLGNVKLYTSPVVPDMIYGYDGFHVTSDVALSSATIEVKTSVPTGATVTCEISDGTYHYGASGSSTGEEMIFSATVTNPHLWNGTTDPHLYNITLNVYHNGDLYHTYQRPYGLRFYSYVINETVNGDTYTGFLLNGQPYLLRGCCMHDDIDGKANALDDDDYTQTFSIIQELGVNFLRLAHYPHPKETYDWCDRLGIIVQTEGPCVNKMQSTMPADYYTHLIGQYNDMVNQHYNHPCICFWGLSNETTTDDKAFAKEKINGYIAQIKALDSERMVGYVMAQGPGSDPSAYYNNPDADWFGCNIYEGWYSNTNSNNPSTQINTRVKNVITNKNKALAYSEYGCGGTQHCHSDDYMTTTTRGNHERHDIEYMMWLHEGHIAAIKNYPQLLFTSQWQLFDIAVSNRNEGYTVCLDGVTTSTDDNLRRLNDKGLVERDHRTKKDVFYLYKAWWNTTDIFVHICGKDYTKMTDRVIKCYTNYNNSLSLYVNDTFVETVSVTDNIATFTARTFSAGDVVRVEGGSTNDTFTFK